MSAGIVAEADVLGQLHRYAEDFGKLYTEYLRVQAQLVAPARQESGLYAQMYARSTNPIMVTDANGVVLSVNPAFTAVTGYAEEDIRGQTPRLLSSGRHDQAFYRDMWQALQGKGEWQGEIGNRRKNGEVYPEWVHIVAVKAGDEGPRCYIAMYYDVGFHRNASTRIYELANHDPLTGLPNRALCKDRLQQAIAQARRNGGQIGLLFIDLDRFKEVNDTLGHAVGDRLLIDFSWQVVHAIRDSDTAARLGGDEFVVVAPGVSGEQDMRIIADKIIESLSTPFHIDGRDLYVGASVGMALYPLHGDDADALLREADAAMYAAKTGGGNACRLFDAELVQERTLRLDMESALRRALERGELHLVYQPQVRASDGCLVGVEALLRWERPGHGTVPPDQFVPLAEAIGLILPIGDWVLRTACEQMAAWRAADLPPLRMAVNIATRQINDPAFCDLVATVLAVTGTPAELLEIEITESQLMNDLNVGLDNLARLRALGVKVAVDDFGTGYSSLGRIRSLPIDRIKIDKSFVADVARSADSYAIASAILAMANALQLASIAEGVEDEDQAHALSGMQCQEFQGFHYCRPQPPEAIAAMLARQKGAMP
jgi:diguanylate cyclase (GGDEF)-like protein/PAS domain S-box-containing protein